MRVSQVLCLWVKQEHYTQALGQEGSRDRNTEELIFSETSTARGAASSADQPGGAGDGTTLTQEKRVTSQIPEFH